MNIELLIQNNENGTIYDISGLANDISWVTEISGQPGKLTFNYSQNTNVVISEGSVVRFSIDAKGVFYGYIFKRSRSENNMITITAYDQLRYLKNKDTYAFTGMTSAQIFTKICKDYQLSARVVNQTSYILSDRLYDNKTLFDIIDWGVTETLAYTGNWYMIRDNFGTLEYVNLNSLKTDLLIGDASLLTKYTYESSIDDDTYNQVKLVKEGDSKRNVYIVKDSSNIKRWGLLQYFETLSEDANDAQIAARAEQLLKLKNRITKTLKVECIGDLKVFAGTGIIFATEELKEDGLDTPRYFMVTSCTHTFSNNEHTMSLDLQVSA